MKKIKQMKNKKLIKRRVNKKQFSKNQRKLFSKKLLKEKVNQKRFSNIFKYEKIKISKEKEIKRIILNNILNENVESIRSKLLKGFKHIEKIYYIEHSRLSSEYDDYDFSIMSNVSFYCDESKIRVENKKLAYKRTKKISNNVDIREFISDTIDLCNEVFEKYNTSLIENLEIKII